MIVIFPVPGRGVTKRMSQMTSRSSRSSSLAIWENEDLLRIVKDGALTSLRQYRMFSAWRTVTVTSRCDTAVTRDATPHISSDFIHLSFRSSALAVRVVR